MVSRLGWALKSWILAALAIALSAVPALPATVTDTFQVSITIQADCTISTALSDINFGTEGVLDTDVAASSTLSCTCSSGTPYTIGLNEGTGTGATVAVRKMTNGGSTVDYSLYTDSGHTTVWGNVSGEWVSANGTGLPQLFTIYGLVPTQTTPAAGTYTDTITVTVTF
ncbi:MAG: Csu type fimbrial protein [Methyloligella sp. ZOD6]